MLKMKSFFLFQKLASTAVLLLSFSQPIVNAQKSCTFMLDAPIIEEILPAFQYSLKFNNVEATVYRHVLSAGSLPRVKVLRYSSAPVIRVDKARNEIQISTESSNCLGSGTSQKNISALQTSGLMTGFAMMLVAGYGFSSRSVGVTFLGMLLVLNRNHFGVDAQDSSCTPTMEIVIEAPPYYLGSVAECKAEVENPDHCPTDFPTYPTCSDHNPSCELAVVGAGTGGLYTAMRLVDEGKVDGKDVCVFEATERVGGRLYSLRGFGPDNKITVDAGGYRTWPEYTPTTQALIVDYLGLKTGCYEDETKIDGPCERFNIVDDDGTKIGFATLPETMMDRLIDAGACFFPRHELVSISHKDDGSNTLLFANGVIAPDVPQVILNVPQRPLLKILRKSDIPFTDGVSEERELYDAAHSVQTEIVTKLYLYYEDAWWHRLKLYNGDFELAGDAQEMLLRGRYHDGHIECDGEDCHGFLLAVYAHDFGGNKAQFFRRYQRDRPEPVTIISNTDTEGAGFLKHAHNRLREHHLYNVVNASYSGFEAQQVFNNAQEPTFAVLATWNIGTYGAGGGWHHWTDLDQVGKATQPLNDYNIHVVNEAFSRLQGWAEGTLLLADEILEEYFSVQRPWAFDAPNMVQRVAQTSSEECEAADGTGGGTGGTTGGTGGTGGGGGDAGDDVLCFTGDSKIEMADGTFKSIADVKKGEYVNTGFPGETGLVTDVLTHEVHDAVEVGVISTSFGDLVGTLSHPIYFNGKWMEMKEALEYEFEGGDDAEAGFVQLDGAREIRMIDVFYNLEIDGNAPGLSSHAYKVNGIIASGLGDGAILNSMFARQNIWKVAL